jgi:uncharacterized protein (TIGR02266 family)
MTTTANPAGTSALVKVLLVDDVDLFVELEKTFLRRVQIRILAANNGLEALRLAREERPELIILDLFLPGLNGDEVCRQLKADAATAGIPVVMVVQQGNQNDRDICHAAGCDEVLYKPLRREDFILACSSQLSLCERSVPRLTAQLPVHYGMREERMIQKYTVNLSAKGMYLATEAYLPLKTQLYLRLEIPDGQEPLSCRGRVAWFNHPDWIRKPKLPHGMGIEFTEISAAQQQRLADYLDNPDLFDIPT